MNRRRPCNIPRDVVRLLGAFGIVGLVGVLALIWCGRTPPEGLIALIGTAVGSLSSILSSTRPGEEHDSPTSVTVANPPTDPVPVTTAEP